MQKYHSYYLIYILSSLSIVSCNSNNDEKFREYKVISSGCGSTESCPTFKNPREAMKEIEKLMYSYLQEGYEPVGGISVVTNNRENSEGVVMYQAIAKK